jgi:hypothetical protein
VRAKLFVLHGICLLTWVACANDASERDPLTSSATRGDSGDGTAPDSTVPDAGASETEAAIPQGVSPVQRDAGPEGSLPLRDAGSQGDATPHSEGGAPAQSDAGSGSTCPNKYATAVRVRVDMSWPDTVGYWGGEGSMQVWSKVVYTRTASGTTIDSAPCGVALPVVTSTPLLDGAQFANDIPVSAFDQPSMPHFAGRTEWRDGKLVVDTGASVIGAALSDSATTWPYREAIPLADHDGDGKPAMTAIARKDPPFALPPSNIAFTDNLDEVYVASRISLRLTAPGEGCREPVEGSVEPRGFDYTIVGCHILNGGECGATALNLVNNQSPKFALGSSGKWTSVPLDENARCADVRKALPAE